MSDVVALFRALAPYGVVLEPLLSLASQGRLTGTHDSYALTRLAGLARARQPELVHALTVAASSGAVMRSSEDSWAIELPEPECRELATLLRGAVLYREYVHRDSDTASAVVSMPAAPSQLVEALSRTLEGAFGLEATENVLGQMTARAAARFTVMTPFVDANGARRIVELFAATAPSVRRELIVRDGLPTDLLAYTNQLRLMEVRAYDFRIPRLNCAETETFHAKVVRVDDAECYVGSSNMTKWSFEYSLELGMHIRGQAARTVGRVLDAVISVSTRIDL